MAKGTRGGKRAQKNKRYENWLKFSGIRQVTAKDVKVGSEIATKEITPEGTAKRIVFKSTQTGARQEMYDDIVVTEVKKIAKTVKVTGYTKTGNKDSFFSRTYKADDSVALIKKAR